MIVSITSHNFKQEIQEAKKPVIIDVYATWCGPCQHVLPIFEELEKELGQKYVFAKLNVDEARDIALEYQVSSVPTFVFIKDNQIVGKLIGYQSKEDLTEKIDEFFNE